jgi:hypothetical protein
MRQAMPCHDGGSAATHRSIVKLQMTISKRPKVKLVEPPSRSSKIVLIGKNRRGCWVAQEQNGLYGRLFVSGVDAVRYALFENGHDLEAIVSTPGILEVDMGRNAS